MTTNTKTVAFVNLKGGVGKTTSAIEPFETPAENITGPGKDGRKRPKWLPPLIAAVCAVLLFAVGIIGWNAYSGAKLAEAKEACAAAADAVRSNANEYNALLNGDAADAAAVKAEQVKDSKTVESLGRELKAMAPEYEGCVAEDAQGLDAATVKLTEQADWYETHEKSLSKAVRAVTESKAAKRLETAKTNLTAKLDEASKLLADSDGKVADNATRDALSNAIDAANGLKDGNDPAKIDGARKTVEDAINGVNASVQGKDGRGCASRRSGRPGSGAGPIRLQRRLLLLRWRVQAHGRLRFRLQHIPWHHIGRHRLRLHVRLRPGRRLRPEAEPQWRPRVWQQLPSTVQ